MVGWRLSRSTYSTEPRNGTLVTSLGLCVAHLLLVSTQAGKV